MQFFCQNFQQHRWQNRFVYAFATPDAVGGAEAEGAAEATDEGFDFSNVDFEPIDFDDIMDNESASGRVEEDVQTTKKEEKSWLNRASEWVETIGESETFTAVRKAFEKGDLSIAAEVFNDVMDLSSQGRDKVLEKYGNFSMYSAGKDIAYAILAEMGVSVKDRTRARRGEATIDNIPLDIPEADIRSIKQALIPEDTWVKYAVKFYTGQNELEDYQKVLLAPGQAVENTVRGILNLPSTAVALAKMATAVDNNTDLQEIGMKGDLLIKIIDEYFTPGEKLAFITQFVAEGMTGAGVSGILAKFSKIPRIAGLIQKIGQVDKMGKLQKGGLMATRMAQKLAKAGSGRAAGTTAGMTET